MNNKEFVRPPRRAVLLMLCMAIFAVAPPNSAQAQDWRFEPIVKVGGEYDDNATLSTRTDQEVSLTGYLLDLRADIKYSSPTTTFLLQPGALLRNYPNESNFDSDDFFLRSQFEHKGQTSTIGLRANFDEQSVRTAERAVSDLEIDDPDEITNDDTGDVFLFGTRSKWRISPSWDYRLSSTSSMGANIDYYDVQYEDVLTGFFTDYTDARLNLNYRHAFSDVNTGLLTVTARRYDGADAFDDITGYGVAAGFEHALSEKMRLKAMFGFEDSQQSGFETDPQVTGYITLTRNLRTISMFAQYRRAVSASGAGALTVRDALNLNFRRRLNEKISAGLGVRAYKSADIGGVTPIEDRNYVQLQSSFLWYLSKAFVIEADYRYTVNDRDAIGGERSNSNQVNLWFVYQPKTTPRL